MVTLAPTFFSDLLSVPSMMDPTPDPLGNSLTNMDLEAFAFRKGKDPMAAALYDTDILIDLNQTYQDPSVPAALGETFEVPSWSPAASELSPAASPSLESQASFSSDEVAASPNTDAASPEMVMPMSPAPVRRQRTIPTEPAGGAEGFLVDLEAEDDMLMSPQEEARLRSLLLKKQHDLETCTLKMKGLTPQNKKRLRNRHASCVSRLKKKLYICNLQRDLEKAKSLIAGLQADAEAQAGTIALLRGENARLSCLQQHQVPE